MLTQSLVEPLGKCTPPKCRQHKQPGEKRGGFQRRETPSATGNSGNHQIAARSDHQIVARCSCLPFFCLRLCFNIVFFFDFLVGPEQRGFTRGGFQMVERVMEGCGL